MRYVAPELVVGVLSALPYTLVLQRRLLSPSQTEDVVNGVDHLAYDDEAAALCGASPTALFQAAVGRHDAVTFTATTLLGCIFGFKEASFVVASLLLHVLNTVLLYKFCCKFASGRRNASERVISTAAMFASIVFAVHPLRSDVVCGPSNLAYSLTLCLGLCSTITFLSTFRTRSLLAACVFAVMSAASYALASMATPLIAPLPVVYVLGVLGGYQRSQPLLSSTASTILNGCVTVSFLTAIGVVGRYTLLPLLPSDAAQLASGITAQRVELLVYTFHRLLLSHIYPARVDLHEIQHKLAAESVDTCVLLSLAMQLALFVWCGIHVLFALLQRKGPKAASITYFALLAMYFPSLLGAGGDGQSADRATYLPACIFSVIFTISFIDTVVLPSVTARSGTDVVMLVRDDEQSRRHTSSDKPEESTTMLHCRRRLFSHIKKISWALVVLLLVTTYFTTQMRFTAGVATQMESAIVRPSLDLLGSDTEAASALIVDSSEFVPNTTVQDAAADEQEEEEEEEVVDTTTETVEEATIEVEAVAAESSLHAEEKEEEDVKAELVEEAEATVVGGEDAELTVAVESEPSQEDLQSMSAPPVDLLEDCGCSQEAADVAPAESEAEVDAAPAEVETAVEEEEPESVAVVAVEVEAADGEAVVQPELSQEQGEQPAVAEEPGPEATAEEALEAAVVEESGATEAAAIEEQHVASAVVLTDEQAVVAVDEQVADESAEQVANAVVAEDDVVEQEPNDDSQAPDANRQHEEDQVVDVVEAEHLEEEEEEEKEKEQAVQDELPQQAEELVLQEGADAADAAEQTEHLTTETEAVHEKAEEVHEQVEEAAIVAVEEQQAEAADESAEAEAVIEEQIEAESEEEEVPVHQEVRHAEVEEETEQEQAEADEAVMDEAPAAEVDEAATDSADEEQPNAASEPDLPAAPAEEVLDDEAN